MTMKILKQDETLLNGVKPQLALLAGCSNPGIIAVGIVPMKDKEPHIVVSVYGSDTFEATERCGHLHRAFDEQSEQLGLGALSKRPEFKGVAKQAGTSVACHMYG